MVVSSGSNQMTTDRSKLFDSADDFFSKNGSAWMTVSPAAAMQICMAAAANGKVVSRIEGGIWHSPGFESRHDCIWDGADPPMTEIEANINNLCGLEFIKEEMHLHSVFILTTPSFHMKISGE